MSIVRSLRIAWLFSIKDIKLHAFRSILTILAISIGIATFIALRIVGVGTSVAVKNVLNQLIAADLLVYGEGVCDVPLTVMDVIKQIPGVKSVTPIIIFKGHLNQIPVTICGVTRKSCEEAFNIRIVEGRLFNDNERNVIVITDEMASSANIKCGQIVSLKPETLIGGVPEEYKVIGVAKASFRISGLSIMGSIVLIPLSDAQRLLETEGYVSALFIRVKDKSLIQKVKTAIESMYPDALIMEQKEILQRIMSVLRIIHGMLLSITLIGIIVALFSTANTIMTNVREHVRDIGIMKSIGATRSQILTIFIFEALIYGMIGGIVGAILGYIGSHGMIILLHKLGFQFNIPIILDYETIAVGYLMSILVGLIAAIYPSYKAASVRPVEALRYE